MSCVIHWPAHSHPPLWASSALERAPDSPRPIRHPRFARLCQRRRQFRLVWYPSFAVSTDAMDGFCCYSLTAGGSRAIAISNSGPFSQTLQDWSQARGMLPTHVPVCLPAAECHLRAFTIRFALAAWLGLGFVSSSPDREVKHPRSSHTHGHEHPAA